MSESEIHAGKIEIEAVESHLNKVLWLTLLQIDKRYQIVKKLMI